MELSDKQIQTFRVREDLKLQILKLLYSFKSTEEPKRKINEHDIDVVLSELLHNRLKRK
jgi:hypothetical protein